MTATVWYRAGTANFTAGSRNVAGTGTLWLANVQAGDLLWPTDANGNITGHAVEVESITSDTALVLKTIWPGSTASAAKYGIVRNFTGTLPADIAAKLVKLINQQQIGWNELTALLQTSGPVTLTTLTGETISTMGLLSYSNAVPDHNANDSAHGMTATGRALVRATDAAGARSALGLANHEKVTVDASGVMDTKGMAASSVSGFIPYIQPRADGTAFGYLDGLYSNANYGWVFGQNAVNGDFRLYRRSGSTTNVEVLNITRDGADAGKVTLSGALQVGGDISIPNNKSFSGRHTSGEAVTLIKRGADNVVYVDPDGFGLSLGYNNWMKIRNGRAVMAGATDDGVSALQVGGAINMTDKATTRSNLGLANHEKVVVDTGGSATFAGNVKVPSGASVQTPSGNQWVAMNDANNSVRIGVAGGESAVFSAGGVQVGSNISNYGTLNVARYAESPQSTITLGDGATPSNDVGVYFRQTAGVAGFSTAGADFGWFTGSPGINKVMGLAAAGRLFVNTTDDGVSALQVGGSGRFTGNVGIGVTPPTMTGASVGTQRAAFGSLPGGPYCHGYMASNCYPTGSFDPASAVWRYNSGAAGDLGDAAMYEQRSGQHYFKVSGVQGLAGAAVSWSKSIVIDAKCNLTSSTDNNCTLGGAANRWSTIYAGTGTINTSDAREKTVVRPLTVAEINASKQLASEIGVYQWLDAVASKGDKAREHIGLTVQRAIEIMEANGLAPFSYGFICRDVWEAQYSEVVAVDGEFSRNVERQVTVDEIRTRSEVQIIDGVPTLVEIPETIAIQQFKEVPVVDKSGSPVMIDVPEKRNKKGKVTEPASKTLMLHIVPVMEVVEERYNKVCTQQAGDRFAFRYDELNLFIARGFDARLSALEAK